MTTYYTEDAWSLWVRYRCEWKTCCVGLHLSKPLCSELLCHLLLSTLPQCCQDRAPSPLLPASITFTIQPSVEDITTGFITAMTVVTLHCINHVMLHTEVKCQLVPVAGNSATYELFKAMQSGFGVKAHGNTWSGDWNTLQVDTRRLQHCTGAHACRTNEWQGIEGQMVARHLESQLGTVDYRLDALHSNPLPYAL